MSNTSELVVVSVLFSLFLAMLPEFANASVHKMYSIAFLTFSPVSGIAEDFVSHNVCVVFFFSDFELHISLCLRFVNHASKSRELSISH